MSTLHERKQKVIDFICNALGTMEGGSVNASLYRKEWEAMSDKAFEEMMKAAKEEHLRTLKPLVYFEIEEFERDLVLENIEKCAKSMGVPLYEYVAIPDVTGDDDNVVVTPYPVPVGYAHYKRMQQTILKKNNASIRVNKKNPLTGQVVSNDKTVRNTNVETYAMMTMGAKEGLREMMGPRADDPVMENQMYTSIANNGYARLADMTSDPRNKTAINSLNMYYLMQGFITNLVGPMGDLPKPPDEV